MKISPNKKKALFKRMLLIRRFEEKVKKLYGEGRIKGAIHLCIGQEAVAVGVCGALRKDDYIFSTHRGHGHAIAKGVGLKGIMAELMGKETGVSRGHGGSMHLFDPERGLMGGNGIVGGGIPLALGAAFSAQYRGTGQVSVAFFSEGAANQGVFAESLNLAALYNLPVIFVCENNCYAATTPATRSFARDDIASRASSYGVPAVVVDGNDVEKTYDAAKTAVAKARQDNGPCFIECRTYRIEPHCGIIPDQREKGEREAWKTKDPVALLKTRLIEGRLVTNSEIADIEKDIRGRIERAVVFAEKSPLPDPESAAHKNCLVPPPMIRQPKMTTETRALMYRTAITEAMKEEMERDDRVFVIGEDVDLFGGVYKMTKGLAEQFGKKRVRGTPISEAAFIGLAVGAAMTGLRPIVEIMYMDFAAVGMDQLMNQAAKIHYMSGGRVKVPLVIRGQFGVGTAEAAQHSQHLESWFMNTPGFKVVMPSTPADAKGLLKSAIRDDNPVLFLENRMLYLQKGDVPAGEWLVPLGAADVKREGTDITVVATSNAVHKALAAAERLAGKVGVEVIDPRTLDPLDLQTIIKSLKKTGRLLVVQEGPVEASFGAELVRRVVQEGFDLMKCPPLVLGARDVPVPFSPILETAYVPQVEDILEAVNRKMLFS